MKLLSAFKFLLFLFIFTAMSCEEIILEKTFTIGRESKFRMSQLYTSNDGQYTLQINEINDSRCPQGVQCVWQGEVTLKGHWTDNQVKSDFELHSVVKSMEKQPVGFSIQIVDARPYPVHGTETKPEDLVITLLIEKNNSKLDTIFFTHSMKGWELYSWPQGNDWNYSILPGTNREKTYDEVIANKIRVIGKDSLKMLLDKFPAKEELFWTGKRSGDGWANLSFPDDNTINEIKNYCQQKELVLSVIQ